MKCHNQLCIYQEEDQCMLEEIELDAWGRCENSIATILHRTALKEEKKALRNYIENRAAVSYKMKKSTSE